MLNERNRRTAEKCGILPLVEKLQADLMTIEGVEDVDFDLDGFLDNIPYVIFLPKYNLPMDGFYTRRKAMLREILEIAARNGLVRTEDSIEDYGEHLYIVTELRKETTT
mgnify:FL=1